MNALVLSGGGSKGSWQTGALLYCSEHTSFSDGFDVISGTSVGAINALGLAMYPKSKILEASRWLSSMWGSISSNKSIWRWRIPWYLSGLWSDSIYTTHPIHELLKKKIDLERVQQSGVKVRLMAADLCSGAVRCFTEEEPDLLIDGAMASSSMPVFFPPVRIGDGYYTDGGIRDVAPLGRVISDGATKILVLLSSNPYLLKTMRPSEFGNIFKVLLRVISILTNETMLNDISICQQVNSEVISGERGDARVVDLHILMPSRPLSQTLEFNPEEMRDQLDLGYSDAASYFSSTYILEEFS